jgi:6-phosphogluconolactonase
MTLTSPARAEARQILFLVTGEEKREPLQQLIAADPSIPAGRVKNDAITIVADQSASPE